MIRVMRDVNNEWNKRYHCHKAREHPGPCGYAPILIRSPHQNKLARLNEIARLAWGWIQRADLEPIKIHAAR